MSSLLNSSDHTKDWLLHFSFRPSCEAMEDTVKDFSVSYNRINNEDTFTGGDFISGNIKLELSKDCKINSLYVQIKGKANVLWTEQYGKTVVVYSSKEKFFTIKQSVIQEFKGQGKCAVYNMNLIHMCNRSGENNRIFDASRFSETIRSRWR